MFLLRGSIVLFRYKALLVGRIGRTGEGLWVQAGWFGVLSAGCFVLDESSVLEDVLDVCICLPGCWVLWRKGVSLAGWLLGLFVRWRCVG